MFLNCDLGQTLATIWESETFVRAKRKLSTCWLSCENLRCKGLNLPGAQHCIFVTAYPGGIKHILRHSMRTGSWKLYLALSRFLPQLLFSFLLFCFCFFFFVQQTKNYNQSKWLWSPVPTDTTTIQLPNLWLRDYCGRGSRRILRVRGSGNLLWGCVSWDWWKSHPSLTVYFFCYNKT